MSKKNYFIGLGLIVVGTIVVNLNDVSANQSEGATREVNEAFTFNSHIAEQYNFSDKKIEYTSTYDEEYGDYLGTWLQGFTFVDYLVKKKVPKIDLVKLDELTFDDLLERDHEIPGLGSVTYTNVGKLSSARRRDYLWSIPTYTIGDKFYQQLLQLEFDPGSSIEIAERDIERQPIWLSYEKGKLVPRFVNIYNSGGLNKFAPVSISIYDNFGKKLEDRSVTGNEDYPSPVIKEQLTLNFTNLVNYIKIKDTHPKGANVYKESKLLDEPISRTFWIEASNTEFNYINSEILLKLNPIKGIKPLALTSAFQAQPGYFFHSVAPEVTSQTSFSNGYLWLNIGEKPVGTPAKVTPKVTLKHNEEHQTEAETTADITVGSAVELEGSREKGNTGFFWVSPNTSNRTISIVGAGDDFGSGEQFKLTHFDTKGTIRNTIDVQGTQTSKEVAKALHGRPYEVGDYFRIQRVNGKAYAYQENKVQDTTSKNIVYQFTETGWTKVETEVSVVPKQNITLKASELATTKPESLVDVIASPHNPITSVAFNSATWTYKGRTNEKLTPEIVVTDTFGEKIIIPTSVGLLAEEAIELGGDRTNQNQKAHVWFMPDSKTKTFKAIGTGNLGINTDYFELIHYDDQADKVKTKVTLKGSDISPMNILNTAFKDKPYKVGDFFQLKLLSNEAKVYRYLDNNLLPQDSSRSYWYKMTETGWKEASPITVIPKENIKINILDVPKLEAKDLIDVNVPEGTSISSINFETKVSETVIGQKQKVKVRVTDSTNTSIDVDIELELLGGESIKIRGNMPEHVAYRWFGVNAKEKKFVVFGKSNNLHSELEDRLFSVVHYDIHLQRIKNHVTVNGIGENSDADSLNKAFHDTSYEVGDFITIYHAQGGEGLVRYKNNTEITPTSEKNYWYQLTEEGWKEVDSNPVDPENPANPIVPTNPVNPNIKGLSLLYVSDFNFGQLKINGEKATAYAKPDTVIENNQTKAIAPFIGTNDTRGEGRKGWSLTVKQTEPFKDTKGNPLLGAQIHLSNIYYVSAEGAPVLSNKDVTINHTAQEISYATEKNGNGKWSASFGKLSTKDNETVAQDVTLTVPATAAINESVYQTKLTWELVADPTK